MLTLPPEFLALMIEFQPLFSKRVFDHVLLLTAGALLAPGKRTITSILRIMGLSQERRYHKYHRVLSRARWRPPQAALILLRQLVRVFASCGPIVFGLDETIERRRGKRIGALGIYRDNVRSSRGHFVKASGLRWMSLMMLTPIPWAKRVWALPFLTVLCPSQRYAQEQGRRYKKLTDWARQLVLQLRRWLPERDLVVVADSSYAALDLLAAVGAHVSFITRLRLDAALYEPVPPRAPSQRGRRRKKGARLPRLSEVLSDPATQWQTMTVAQWYGRRERTLEVSTGTCLWFHYGKSAVPIRWVLVRDPEQKLKPTAFLSTNQGLTPEQIISFFVRRWCIEVTFEEVRAHLGVETQRQWSHLAIERTTPVLLALFSITTLWANGLKEQNKLQLRTEAWYPKPVLTFSDAIAAVRTQLWRSRYFPMSEKQTEMVKIPRPLLNTLTQTLAYAA